MDQRLSLLALAVDDLARARAFYAALGWREATEADAPVAVFDLPGFSVMLCPRAVLAKETGGAIGEGASGAAMAINVRERSDIEPMHDAALAAGAREISQPTDRAWGGRSSYFADPDGHIWEIGWNPFSPLGPNGEFQWSGA